jgi:hypothetical protein
MFTAIAGELQSATKSRNHTSRFDLKVHGKARGGLRPTP